MINSKKVLAISLLLVSAVCGAMVQSSEEIKKNMSSEETFLACADIAGFNSLTSDERWECYSRLLSEFDKQADVIKTLKDCNAEAKKNIQEKDSKIANLLKAQEERNWKTIGITFLSTVGGLAVLGKVIDRK